jgi:quercetin dioxygenase-like cupin family protein
MPTLVPLVVVLALAGFAPHRLHAENAPPPSPAAPAAPVAPAAHVMLAPDAVTWQPFPPGGPGAQTAVLAGDPDRAGPFVLRIKLPAKTRVAPHWHPTDENVTVIQGSMGFGMGKKFDRAAIRQMPAGSYLLMPKGQPHFAWSESESIVQVHGTGPFAVIYVDPADDPRNPAGTR